MGLVDAYKQLENKYPKMLGVEHACVTNTGTAALHLALEALELPPKTQVIVPEFTMYASGMAVHYARLNPVFIDCDDNLLIDLDKVEQHFERTVNLWHTKVLMVTHVYGRTVDMDRVMDIAKKYKLRVIEDACEAQGAYHNGKAIGSYDIGCFSFYRNKIISAEEGGIIVSNDEELINKARDMRSMSFGEEHNYHHKRIGFNYRCTNSQAQMVLDDMELMDFNIKTRQMICDKYNSEIPKEYQMPNNRNVVWVYDMKHPKADEMVKRLKKRGVPARHSFKPMSTQPIFNHWDVGKKAKHMSENVFYVGINLKNNVTYLNETDSNINAVKEVLNEL